MRRIGSALILFVACASGGNQPFSAGDWWALRTVGDPQISEDGGWIVYAEGWKDRQQDSDFSNLWSVSHDGKTRRQLTQGAWRDFWPRWSPDASRIAYVSDRGGGTQIRLRRLDSGTETEILGPPSPLNLAWSPDGTMLAFTAPVPIAATPQAWAPEAILPLMVRKSASHIQLFVVPVEGGAARQVTKGDLDHTGNLAWMPDGQTILISARPTPDAQNALEGGEIYAVRPADGMRKQLTRRPGPDESPVPSPDGGKIAWLAREAKPQSYAVWKLYVMNADGSRVKVLAGTLDRDVRSLQWSSDSRTLYFLADDHGSTHIYAARNDGSTRQVTQAVQRLRGFSLAGNGIGVTVRSSGSGTGELIALPVDRPGSPVKLAAPNESLLAGRDIGRAEEIRFASEGKTIQGWVTKPPDFDAAKKYPLLLDIQDAPRRMCGPEFRPRAQLFASRGYVVLCANPRGTPGYGEEFGNLIHSRYPGDDFDDLMRGVDAVIALGYVDPKRVTVVGGLLAAWAIGHTDRFAAAVARRPITDWVTEVTSSPDGYFRAAAWMGAMPWENPEQYLTHSPFSFAQNFKTPTLVIAGEHDPQSEALHFALRSRKVETELVRLKPAKPSEELLELETTLAWFQRFTGKP